MQPVQVTCPLPLSVARDAHDSPCVKMLTSFAIIVPPYEARNPLACFVFIDFIEVFEICTVPPFVAHKALAPCALVTISPR